MKYFLIYTLLFLCSISNAQIITNYAGNGGTPFALGDGGPATAANIAAGGDAITDNAGNLYILEGHGRLRKVNAVTGIITTYAGNGTVPETGDGGPATAAGGIGTGWIAIDAADNMYLAAAGGHRIRKITATTGIITTIAGGSGIISAGDGGPAAAATFAGFGGIAADGSGNVYICDSNRIRKIDAATGIITHFAGTGSNISAGDGGSALSASFQGGALCIDPAGNLYISDGGVNLRIRKINISGIITTIAGNGTAAYGMDEVPATSTGFGSYDIAADNSGNIYIADRYNSRIRMVDGSGIIHTVAGNGVAGYSGNGGPATAAQIDHPEAVVIGRCDGNLYIDDFGNKRFRKVDFTGLPTACTCTPSVTIAASPGATVCTGTAVTYTATVASGGTANSYQWLVNGVVVSTAGSTYTYTPANGDVVQCTVTTSGTPCAAAITVSSNTITMVVSAATPITGALSVCVGQSTPFANATGGGAWSSGNTAVATVSSTGVVTGASAGTAVISYTVSGCYATKIITVDAAAPATTGTLTVCAGSTTTLSNSSSGGTWSSGNTAVATVGAATGVVSGIAAGTAAITYFAPTGCYTIAVVTVNSMPSAITGALSLCAGSSATLGSPPSGGVWSSGNTAVATVGAATGTVTAISAGTAVITYNISGCYVTAVVTVNTSLAPITGTLNLCTGATTALGDASGGGVWSSGNTAVATVGAATGIASGIAAGTAGITYASGSCGYVTAIVTVSASPAAITGTLSICAGATTPLSDASSGGAWSSGAPGVASVSASGLVSGNAAGTAVITYSRSGCNATAIVTVFASPSAITGTLGVCAGASAALGNTAAGGTWSSGNTAVATVGAATGIVSGIAAGTAIITYATGSCGSAMATVTVQPAPAAIAGSTIVCAGSTTALTNAAAGGTWSSGNAAVAAVDATGVVSGAAAGTAAITYAQGSCYTVAVVSVTAIPAVAGTLRACAGQVAALSDAATGGTWSSDNAAIATVGSSSGIVTGIAAGTAGITYTTGGCMASATFTVDPLPDAGSTITGPGTVCAGAAIALANAATGGTWSSSNASATISATGVVNGITPGTDTISYAVANASCSAVATTVITINALPGSGAIAGPAALCAGAAAKLSETAAGGTWSSGNTAVAIIDSATGAISAVATGTAIITYTVTAGGCRSTATFTITVIPPSFTISNTVTPPQCNRGNNGSIAVSVSGGHAPFSYQWSTGASTAALPGIGAGTYIVTVTETSTQCSRSDTILLTAPDPLLIATAVKKDNCKTGSGSIKATVGGGTAPYQYVWSPAAGSGGAASELSGLAAGAYSLSVTDANGCAQGNTAVVEDTCSGIVVNDGISPNGDGINDVWVIDGITLYPGNTVQVYDKWGDMVYERAHYQNDWNGTGSTGSPLPDGNYYYVVKLNAPNLNGGNNVFTGSLLIKR